MCKWSSCSSSAKSLASSDVPVKADTTCGGVSWVSRSMQDATVPRCVVAETLPAQRGACDHELTWPALSVIPVAWISVVGIIQHSQRNLTTQAGDCKDPKGEAEMVWRLLFSIELDAAASWWWNIDVDSCDDPELVDSVARQRFGWGRPRSHNKLAQRNW